MRMSLQGQQLGSSLLEVLISLVILAVGMLGMTGLQSASLRSNQNAYMRTQATIYSLDIVERIHANQTGAKAGSYNNGGVAQVAGCSSVLGCSPAQLARNDLFEWQTSIAANLPSGVAKVCLDSSPNDGTFAAPSCDGTGGLYVVKIWWDDERDGTVNRNHVMSFTP